MIQYILNGNIAHPKNRTEIKFGIDYSNRKRVSEYEMTIENLIFVKEDYAAIQAYKDTYSRFHDMPLDVVFIDDSTGSVQQVLQYQINFSESNWSEVEFHAKVYKYKGIVNFFNRADGLSWRLVNFQESDFTTIRYVIVPEQQPLYFITLALATFATAQQLAQAIEDIQQGIADLVATLPPVPGNAGQIVAASIRLAARIARAVALTIALIQLMQRIIEMVMPQVRTMKDIPYLHLIRKGVEHLGYTLDVTDIQELNPLSFLGTPERALDGGIFREIFMPLSFAYTWGYPSEMDSIPTLGRAIERLEDLFNLKTTVSNGVVRIERVDNQQVLPTPIPLAYNDKPRALNNYKYNNEVWKRKILMWTKDGGDTWTYDDKRGHLVEADTSLIQVADPFLENIPGFEQIQNPFALASRKDEFTRVENFLRNVLAPAIDLFTGGAFTSSIDARIGVMVVSSQYFTVNKLLWKQGQNIAPNHRDVLNGRNILQTWHNSETVANRSKIIKENMPVRMTQSLFLQLAGQTNITLSDATVAELVSAEWSEDTHQCEITFMTDDNVNNITNTIIYGAGY